MNNSKISLLAFSACLLTAATAQAQTLTYDSDARHDFAVPHAAVTAGQILVNGWTDWNGGVYSVAGGSLTAVSADPKGYLHGLALRPARENRDTPNVSGTIDVPNGTPGPGTANGLVLRFQPGGTFYLFQLSADTLYIYKITDGQTVTRLQSLAVQPNTADPYALTGSAVNIGGSVALSVSAADTKTHKSIGNLSAVDASDPILQAGQVGVDSWVGNNEMGTATESYARAVFDRLPAAVPSGAKAFPKIGFIGDSITAGYNQVGRTITPGVSDVAALTVQKLAETKALARTDAGVAWSAYDQGSSGSSTADWLPGRPDGLEARAKESFTAAFGKPDPKKNPVWVLVMLGTNDVRSDHLFAAAQHRQNLQAITDNLVADGYNVIINYPPSFAAPTRFNGVTWSADALALLQSYLPAEQAVAASYQTRAPGRVFMGDRSAFGYFLGHPKLFQEYGVYGGLHPSGADGTKALAAFWASAFRQAAKK